MKLNKLFGDFALLVAGVSFGFSLCTMALISAFTNLPLTALRFPLFYFDIGLLGLIFFVLFRRKE